MKGVFAFVGVMVVLAVALMDVVLTGVVAVELVMVRRILMVMVGVTMLMVVMGTKEYDCGSCLTVYHGDVLVNLLVGRGGCIGGQVKGGTGTGRVVRRKRKREDWPRR